MAPPNHDVVIRRRQDRCYHF